jgi:hypothetical protein
MQRLESVMKTEDVVVSPLKYLSDLITPIIRMSVMIRSERYFKGETTTSSVFITDSNLCILLEN